MATYATYRHVELDNVGYGKKRVLKPPGGGSSDIFGAAPEETSPRRVKNHNQSQLGSALFGDTPNSNSNETPRNKPGNDSYNRLFGPPDAPPTTPNAKNHMRSNISLSGESTSSSVSSGAATSPAKSTGSTDSIAGVLNGYAASNGNNLTNDVTAFRRIKRFHGNPVTGTGYAESQNNGPAVQNGTSSSNSSEKSNDTSPAAKVPARTRVPPGGYSSGLW
ncbi:microtubule-associated protein Jupiter isoform X5 [Bombus vosnesenskii]|uniref:Microtubule-associated protein Jupiter n=2 Tax=Pyrobombus TaxID=144703 RepID=A0A6J3K1B5_9HYME|nr:microtubule-associated protein Jupiter isoform X5 [Bombus impatiens]XP_033346862.1 microtubule-associated protein Jupiter isoform X5 [Bombus vosnesenskii]XP_050477715.1 microtubule-associated protein Jupiter isoform X5 [Bombus huntii]